MASINTVVLPVFNVISSIPSSLRSVISEISLPKLFALGCLFVPTAMVSYHLWRGYQFTWHRSGQLDNELKIVKCMTMLDSLTKLPPQSPEARNLLKECENLERSIAFKKPYQKDDLLEKLAEYYLDNDISEILSIVTKFSSPNTMVKYITKFREKCPKCELPDDLITAIYNAFVLKHQDSQSSWNLTKINNIESLIRLSKFVKDKSAFTDNCINLAQKICGDLKDIYLLKATCILARAEPKDVVIKKIEEASSISADFNYQLKAHLLLAGELQSLSMHTEAKLEYDKAINILKTRKNEIPTRDPKDFEIAVEELKALEKKFPNIFDYNLFKEEYSAWAAALEGNIKNIYKTPLDLAKAYIRFTTVWKNLDKQNLSEQSAKNAFAEIQQIQDTVEIDSFDSKFSMLNSFIGCIKHLPLLRKEAIPLYLELSKSCSKKSSLPYLDQAQVLGWYKEMKIDNNQLFEEYLQNLMNISKDPSDNINNLIFQVESFFSKEQRLKMLKEAEKLLSKCSSVEYNIHIKPLAEAYLKLDPSEARSFIEKYETVQGQQHFVTATVIGTVFAAVMYSSTVLTVVGVGLGAYRIFKG